MLILLMVQVTLASPWTTLVADGAYTNAIPAITVNAPFTEICWVAGSQQVDLHPAGGSTSGGNCAPGATGFLIEQEVRAALPWAQARESCIAEGLRLPEVFEWLFACPDAAALDLGDTFAAPEAQWIGNAPILLDSSGLTMLVAGSHPSSCTAMSQVGIGGGTNLAKEFRCAR